jgi:hypothetical protein
MNRQATLVSVRGHARQDVGGTQQVSDSDLPPSPHKASVSYLGPVWGAFTQEIRQPPLSSFVNGSEFEIMSTVETQAHSFLSTTRARDSSHCLRLFVHLRNNLISPLKHKFNATLGKTPHWQVDETLVEQFMVIGRSKEAYGNVDMCICDMCNLNVRLFGDNLMLHYTCPSLFWLWNLKALNYTPQNSMHESHTPTCSCRKFLYSRSYAKTKFHEDGCLLGCCAV